MSGGGDGARGRRKSHNSSDLAPLDLAAVGRRVRSNTPGWVLSLPPSSATAAIAAAGLARSWAGRGVDGDSGAGGGGNWFGAEEDGGGAGGGGDTEGTRGGKGGGGRVGKKGSRADREKERRSVCVGARESKDKGSEQDATTTAPWQPAESVAFSAAVAAGKSVAVTDDRRVAAALQLAHTHQQQRRRNRHSRNRFKQRRQPSTGSAIGARGLSFTLGGKGPAAASAVVAAMTEEGLAAAEVSMEAAAAAAAAERQHGLIRTVGRSKRGPCMFTPATSDGIGGRASSTRTALLGTNGGSGGGSGVSSAKGFAHGPRALWEVEATGGLVGPGETKVLVC